MNIKFFNNGHRYATAQMLSCISAPEGVLIIVISHFLFIVVILGFILDVRFGKYTKRKYSHIYWILDNGLKINFLNRHKFKFNNKGRHLFEFLFYSKFIFKRVYSEFQFIPFFEADNREHMIFNLSLEEYQETIEDLYNKNLFSEKELSNLQNIGINDEIVVNLNL